MSNISVSAIIPHIELPGFGRITLPGGERLDLRAFDKTAEAAVNTTAEIFVAALLALLLLGLGWLISSKLAGLTQRLLIRAQLDETAAAFIGSLARYTFFFTTLVAAFKILGISDAGATVLVGAAGLATAFALRNTLTHLAGGFMLMSNRPFKVGDYIEMIDGSERPQGTVKRITLFNTEVNTLTNERVFLPNSKIWENAVINHTYNEVRMIEFKLPLPLGARLAALKKALLPVLQAEKLVLKRPEPVVGFDTHELHHGTMTVIVHIWVRQRDYVEVRYNLLDSMNAALVAEGIAATPAMVLRTEMPKTPKKKK